MEHWDYNPYYSPEKCGLTLVDSIDDAEANYSFDIVAVWVDNLTGRMYWASDSGCSCPSPFEEFHSLEDMGRLTSVRQLEDHFNSETYTKRDLAEKRDLLGKVRELLRQPQSARKS